MNILYLSIRRLRLYYKENPLVSTLFMISGILCILSFLVLYGQYMPFMRANSDKNMSYRYYYFMLKEPSGSYTGLDKICSNYELDSLMITTSETSPQEELGLEIPACTYLIDTSFVSSQLQPSHYLSSFSIENNSVLIGQSFMNYQNGERIKIKNSFYKIAGRWSGVFLMMNPDVFKGNFSFSSITLRTSKRLSFIEIQELIDQVCQDYSIVGIRSPLDTMQKAYDETPASIAAMIFLYLISLLSYLFLTSYLVYSQKTTNSIYRMVGMSVAKSNALIIMDIIIVNFIMIFCSIAVHLALWKEFFRPINIWGVNDYSFADYAFIFLITLSIALIVFIPYVIKRQKVSASLKNWED